MRITKEWIFDNRTDKGGWTRAQLSAVGVEWPARSGWIDRLVGQTISDEIAKKFERVPSNRSNNSEVSATVINRDASPNFADNSTRLWFGKHKGKLLSEVPRSYLDWCFENRVGGGELMEAIAELFAVPVPKKVVKYANQTIGRHELDRLSEKPGFTVVNKMVEGTDVMGLANCEHRFNEFAEWPECQEWDGITAPWLDQCESLDAEFRDLMR